MTNRLHDAITGLALILSGALVVGAVTANASDIPESENTAVDQMPEIEARLFLNWASHLSRYPKSPTVPIVRFVDHSYLVDNACFGNECRVLGWYNDTNIIYLDERFAELDSLFSRSVVVHEMIHYLQHQSGEYSHSCADVAAREAEAYWIQQEYHVANGSFGGARRQHYACASESNSVSTL